MHGWSGKLADMRHGTEDLGKQTNREGHLDTQAGKQGKLQTRQIVTGKVEYTDRQTDRRRRSDTH